MTTEYMAIINTSKMVRRADDALYTLHHTEKEQYNHSTTRIKGGVHDPTINKQLSHTYLAETHNSIGTSILS